jgi:hypothetical protein
VKIRQNDRSEKDTSYTDQNFAIPCQVGIS